MMTTTNDGLGIKEVTTGEATQISMVENVPEGGKVIAEIAKSLPMRRPKKDKQAMAPVRMSPRNPLRSKLSMAKKGKVATINTDEEEEDLQALNIAKEEDEGMDEDIPPTCSATKMPAYVPSQKGKTKVLKGLDETKSSLQTLLLPDGIVFERTHLGHVPTMKFEDWDLADSGKFPHLGMEIS